MNNSEPIRDMLMNPTIVEKPNISQPTIHAIE